MGRLAILMVLGLILVTSYYFISVNKSQMTAFDTTLFLNGAVEVRNIANSYVMSAIGEFTNDKETESEYKISSINSKYAEIVPDVLSRSAMVNVKLEDSNTNANLEEDDVLYTATAYMRDIGSHNNTLTCITEVLTSPFDYGDYALFVNDFDSHYLWTREIIKGDVHINGAFGVKGGIGEIGPVFDGNVTSSDDPYYYGGVTESNFTGFWGDTNFDYGEIDMPTFNIDLTTHPNMLNLDKLKCRYVKFLPNGDVQVSNAWGGLGLVKTISADDMVNKYGGMIYGSGTGGALTNLAVHVEGEVNGNYTVVSPDHIYITGNITYVPDPRVDSTSTSILGLMTHDDLITDWRYGTNSGTKDSMMVMASIFADGSIYAGDHGKPGDYGSFTVYGTRIQGGFDEFLDNTHAIWDQHIFYDERLKYLRPPEFEFSMPYKVVYWKDSL